MAELTYTLGEHPQIIELLSVLEKNNLQRQKEEVQALVGYIDGMEDKLAQMMEEMKEIRLEVGKLHDKGIRAKCAQLVTAAEGKIQQVKAMVSTAKANLISSAGRALAGKEVQQAQELEADKGVLAKLRGLFLSCGKTFSGMERGAARLAEKAGSEKSSVKLELRELKAAPDAPHRQAASKEQAR